MRARVIRDELSKSQSRVAPRDEVGLHLGRTGVKTAPAGRGSSPFIQAMGDEGRKRGLVRSAAPGNAKEQGRRNRKPDRDGGLLVESSRPKHEAAEEAKGS